MQMDEMNDDRVAKRIFDTAAEQQRGNEPSMHNKVDVWCDCCSCEAEPYWLEAMQAVHEHDADNEH